MQYGFPSLPTHIGGQSYGYAPQPTLPQSPCGPGVGSNPGTNALMNVGATASPMCFTCPMTAGQCTAASGCNLCQGSPYLQQLMQLMAQGCGPNGCGQMPEWFRQGFQANRGAFQQCMGAMGMCNSCPGCKGGCTAQNMNQATEFCKNNLNADCKSDPWGGDAPDWLPAFAELCKHMTPEQAFEVVKRMVATGLPVARTK